MDGQNGNTEIKLYPREIQIMRQSQIKVALDYAKYYGVELSIIELSWVTDVLVEICNLPVKGDLKERVTKLDTWFKEKREKQNPKPQQLTD